MSSDPTAAMSDGMMSGRMSAFSIRKNRLPMYAMYTTSRSVQRSEIIHIWDILL